MIYYLQLYNALKSLEEYYSGKYDIIIYYHFYDDLMKDKSYKYLDQYNILNDFNFVKFIESDYNRNYDVVDYSCLENTIKSPHTPYMSKWYHLESTLHLQYDKILFLDCDVHFFDDIADIFELESNKKFYTLYGRPCKILKILYGDNDRRWINSGQFLVTSEDIDNKKIYEDIADIRKKLHKYGDILRKQDLINDDELLRWKFFNEQYCGQMFFENIGISLTLFDNYLVDRAIFTETSSDDILKKYLYYDESTENFVISDLRTKIYHYHYRSTPLFLPKEMRSNDVVERLCKMWREKLESI